MHGRGHSVVVLARGHVLVMEHGKAVYSGGRAGACRVLPAGITGRYLGECTEVSGNAKGVERRPAGGNRVSVKASRTVSTGGVEKRTYWHRALLLPTLSKRECASTALLP